MASSIRLLSWMLSGITYAEYLVGHTGYLAFPGSAIDGDFLVALIHHRNGILDQIIVVDAVRNHLSERVQPVFQGACGNIIHGNVVAGGKHDPEAQAECAQNQPVAPCALLLHDFSLPSGNGSPLPVRPKARGRVYWSIIGASPFISST